MLGDSLMDSPTPTPTPTDSIPPMGSTLLGHVELAILLNAVDVLLQGPTVLVPKPPPSPVDLVRVRSLLVQQLDSPEVQA